MSITEQYLETQAFINHMELMRWMWLALFAIAIAGTAYLLFVFKEED